MTALATVLIPTHDHATTLPFSTGTALAQTVDDLDVVILGDGVDDATRRAAEGLADQDPRVRFVDRPKGPRHGELHRHELLAEVRTPYVLYLSDDDLWLPEHAETMLALLEAGADVTGARYLAVLGTGKLTVFSVDLTTPEHRKLMQDGFNRVGLSGMAHSLEAYRRLPEGWRTTPSGTPTDLHMWRQWIDQPWTRFASAAAVTVVNFPSSQRGSWSAEERDAELRRYLCVTRDRGERGRLFEQALIDDFPRQQWLETQYHGTRETLEWHERTLATVDAELQWHKRTLAATEAALAWLQRDVSDGRGPSDPG